MEASTIRLFLAATTCISGLILLYFAITHLRYLKDSVNRMIEHIKKLIVAKEKEQQVKEETHQALKKIDDKVKETIREIDDSFDERYKKFSDAIDTYKYKLPEDPHPTTNPQPIQIVESLKTVDSTTSSQPITIEDLPKPLVYIGPIAIGLGLLYYFLTKDRKK